MFYVFGNRWFKWRDPILSGAKITGTLRASFWGAVPNHDRTNEVGGARLSKQDVKPCFGASAHLNQVLRAPKVRGANENPDALSCCVVEKALWTQNSPPAFDFRCFNSNLRFVEWKRNFRPCRIFSTFQTQIGPNIKKMASDYFSASLLTAKQVRSSVTKTGGPLPACENWCGANLPGSFYSCEPVWAETNVT